MSISIDGFSITVLQEFEGRNDYGLTASLEWNDKTVATYYNHGDGGEPSVDLFDHSWKGAEVHATMDTIHEKLECRGMRDDSSLSDKIRLLVSVLYELQEIEDAFERARRKGQGQGYVFIALYGMWWLARPYENYVQPMIYTTLFKDCREAPISLYSQLIEQVEKTFKDHIIRVEAAMLFDLSQDFPRLTANDITDMYLRARKYNPKK